MKDLEAHAEAILRAAGSSLKNYTLNGTREAILAAVDAVYFAGYKRGDADRREANKTPF